MNRDTFSCKVGLDYEGKDLEGRYYLQLSKVSLEACLPMFQEKFMRRNTKTRHGQLIRNRPISRFPNHILRLWVDQLNGLGPTWIIDFSLCSLS